jgi:alpha-L-rhamnosidase
MLLRTKKRSWLYPITVGATTIWERWEAIHEDGTISGGGLDSPTEGSGEGMLSFNHYAYGAVVDWMYRNVGGISPTAPGYERVSIQPAPHAHLDACKSSMQTGFGEVAVDWKLSGPTLSIELKVPFGVTAELNLPATDQSAITVNGSAAALGATLTHGDYQITLTNPLVIA